MITTSHLNIGILAHVDAGKTTLAEGILCLDGQIRTPGRVDHRDTVLDHFAMERSRGITIFSKQAQIHWEGRSITLLDTPGHVDFGAEMERTLSVLDAAVLIVSAADGVQAHTETVWKLLKRYGLPVFLFVNKMDRFTRDQDINEARARRFELMTEFQKKLGDNCICFDEEPETLENIASFDELLTEEFLETGSLRTESIAEAVAQRRLFPCYFGSALNLSGIRELLNGLVRFLPETEYEEEFGAKIYKISRDSDGTRLTHMKITGGELRTKTLLNGGGSDSGGEAQWSEKADQLRILNGEKYRVTDVARTGEICAVAGLSHTRAGEGLGSAKKEGFDPVLEPVLTYEVILPQGEDPVTAVRKLRALEEEIPEIRIAWREETKEIRIHVMGEVQTEVVKGLMKERFGMEIALGEGKIVYRETIAAPVVGIGHFEPLRHYAEVHLLLQPGESGSGIEIASALSVDELSANWQRLILTHLREKEHIGVLCGAPVTDLKILLIAGRAHEKHTEGGDFRQATYRAVRQGLMKAQSILLEPVLSFRLSVPTEYIGRAMTDLERMHAKYGNPEIRGETAELNGSVPAATVQGYPLLVNAYTGARGSVSLSMKGYEPCHNTEEVLARIGYDAEADEKNPADSVFCSHGAGCVINWRQVEEWAHVENKWNPGRDSDIYIDRGDADSVSSGSFAPVRNKASAGGITQEEIEEIFARIYGKREDAGKNRNHFKKYREKNTGVRRFESSYTPVPKKKEYLLVDGYNIIFAWDELRELSKINLDSAREKLVDILMNYQGYTGVELILVFDAYKVKGNPGSIQRRGKLSVVYTREAQTADQYIEETVHEIGRECDVTVATSDGLEQMIIFGDGAKRVSARGLKEEIERVSKSW